MASKEMDLMSRKKLLLYMLSATEGHPPRRKRAKFLMNLSVSQGIIVAMLHGF